MAVSAYKGGKLKKHALEGTSLAVDPTRLQERLAFQQLYQRARQAANDPAGFRQRIAAEEANRRIPALAAIAQAQGNLGTWQSKLKELQTQQTQAKSDYEKYGNWLKVLSKRTNAESIRTGDVTSPLKLATDYPDLYQGMTNYYQTLGPTDKLRRKAAMQIIGSYKPLDIEGQSLQSLLNKVVMQTVKPQEGAYIPEVERLRQAAKKKLDTQNPAISEYQSKIATAQKAAQETYNPLAARAQLYSGFFGGI